LKLDYNIYLELAAFPVDCIICVYLFLRYKEKTKVNLSFRRLAIFFTLTDGIDVATAIASSAYTRIPNWLHMFFNTLDCSFAVLASFFFTLYAYTVVEKDGKEEKKSRLREVMDKVNFIVLICDYLLLLQNLATGTVFSYNAAGKYVHGPLFTVVAYLMPLYFLANGCICLLLHRKNYKKTQLISLAVGISFVVGFFLLQMLFFDDWLITFYVASLGLVVMLFTLETPDYPELKRTIEQLDQSKKIAEDAKRQALEANSAKSRFLTQASHEIRTPLNAILGYNDLILKESGEEGVREHAKKIRSSAERLWKFFTELLNFVDAENRDTRAGGVRHIAPAGGFLQPEDEKDTERQGSGRVLVVDDNELNLDLMEHFIGTWASEIVTARNGVEAIAAVRENHFDLIFMDNMMPVMDGVTAFRKMREEELCLDTPVVVVTANALNSDRDHFLMEGFDAFLAKPFTQGDVQTLLIRYLKKEKEEEAEISGIAPEMPETGVAAYGAPEAYEEALAAFDRGAKAGARRIREDLEQKRFENARLRIYGICVLAEKLELDAVRDAAGKLMAGQDGELKAAAKPLLDLLEERGKGAADAV